MENLNTKSRNTEVDNVSVRITSAYRGAELNTDAHLAGIITTIETKSSALTTAIKRMKTESELEVKDELRDKDLRAVYHLVLGFTYHPDELINEAARQVQKVLDNYGLEIVKESYTSESSLINSFLEDLTQTPIQTAIGLLSGCSGLITKLQSSQADFEVARLAFEKEKASEGTLLSATSIKRELIGIINNQLLVYLKAMMLIDEATYGSFVRTVAEIIASNNATVKKRGKKSELAE